MSNTESAMINFLSTVPPEGCIDPSSRLICQSLLIKRISDEMFKYCITNLKLKYE